MSLILCDMCKNLKDSDAEPEGFYVEDHEGEYICEICVEDNNLEYDADTQYIKDFVHCLLENEEAMAENAAMAVTCDIFGIEIDEGYDVLIRAAELGGLFEGRYDTHN